MLGNGIQRSPERGIKPAAEAVRAAFDSRADLWGSYGARLYYSKQEDLEHAMTINYGLRVCVEVVPAGLEPGCYAYTRRLRVFTAYTRVFNCSVRQIGSFSSFELQPVQLLSVSLLRNRKLSVSFFERAPTTRDKHGYYFMHELHVLG